MITGLERIAVKAQQEPHCCFTSLTHHVTSDLLKRSLHKTSLSSSRGVDGETVGEARASFEEWSQDVISKIHRRGYRPPPVARVYIPKPGKAEKRPIGIPTIRDRELQRAVAEVLGRIYEQDFLPCSFGGRPGVSAHEAVSTLKHCISSKKISWVYEADLQNFFGSLDHGWLMRMVEERVGDPRMLTLIRRWLKAGVLEQGRWQSSEVGTPQGGSISVLLSNIYLHYVLDLWFEAVVKRRLKGEAYLCRYLDDFVVCFQLKADAKRFERALSQRLAKFSLKLEPTKTRLVRFGRFAQRDCARIGQKPPTLEFLGFVFYGTHFAAGNYGVGLKTRKSSFRRALARVKEMLLRIRHCKVSYQASRINAVLRGFYQYFGVPLNSRSLCWLYRRVVQIWRRTLGTRSQKGKLTWAKYNKILNAYPLVRARLRYSTLEFAHLSIL